MADALRKGVVQISFDIDNRGLNKVNSDMDKFKASVKGLDNGFDDLKKSVGKVGKNNGFEKLSDTAKKAKESVSGISDETKKLGNTGFSKITSGFDKLKNSLQQGKEHASKLLTPLKNIAKTNVDKLKSGLDKVSTKLTEIAKKAGTACYNGLKKMASVSFKALKAGLTATIAAFGAIGGSAVKGFADYEQLVGGVDTLFKESSGIVQKYANDAYKTAGLSANEYMETVTGFSASLLQSLKGDTKKAAKYADTAISDMSDNANKMGTSMESIQYAYQGFAKQNYTMLDNLKLGYGGTKTEMERLVKDAAKLDKSVKANDMSFGNIVKAIHAVQVEMGIYGTTAKEADKTVTGSLNSMKSAWKNLMVALVTGGDSYDQCLDNMIKSVKTFAKNIVPVIGKAIKGTKKLITDLGKEVVTYFEKNMVGKLGKVGEAIQRLIDKFKDMYKEAKKKVGKMTPIFDSLKDTAVILLDTFGDIVQKIFDFATAESTINTVKKAVDTFNSALKWCKTHWEDIETAITNVIAVIAGLKLSKFITDIGSALFKLGLVKTELTAMQSLTLSVGVTLVVTGLVMEGKGIADTIKEGLNLNNAGELLGGSASLVAGGALIGKAFGGALLGGAIGAIVGGVGMFFAGIWDAIKNGIDWLSALLIGGGGALGGAGVGAIIGMLGGPIGAGVGALIGLAVGALTDLVILIVQKWDEICAWCKMACGKIGEFFSGLWNGIKTKAIEVWGSICSFFSGIATWIDTNVIQPVKNFFVNAFYLIVGIAVTIWEKIKVVIMPIVEWVNTNLIQPIKNFFIGLWEKICSIVTAVKDWFVMVWGVISSWVMENLITPIITAWNNLKTNASNAISNVKETIVSIWGTISGWVNTNIITPVTEFFTGLWDNITTAVDGVKTAITEAFQGAWDFVTDLWGGITGFFSDLWDGIKDTVNTLIGKGKEALGVESDVKSKEKGTKHAWGGLMTTPHWGQVAEDGPEMIIPLSKEKRNRGLNLWQQAGQIMGVQPTTPAVSAVSLPTYTPESSVTTTTNATHTENNSYSPVFNLTVNGASDPREVERNVKRWVKEAMDDMFNSIARKSPNLVEV